MISILNYGLGNISAFSNIYSSLGCDFMVVSDPSSLERATRIVLPGVGSFDWAMNCLNSSGLREVLEYKVQQEKVPILGVCVGMQIMASSSDEGTSSGLGWINTKVKSFKLTDSPSSLPVPHMGWNSISVTSDNDLFHNLDNNDFYFLHSYYFDFNVGDIVSSVTNYSVPFVSSFVFNNIIGVQFHPEKSHSAGIQLLHNFALF